jgi:hypothetical protein
MITEIVAAAGRGAELLRETGTDVMLEDCSIEVMVDEAPTPAAQVRIRFTAAGTAQSS